MGSRMMHAIIAVETAKVLKPKNIDHFLLGSIAPDATNNKEPTHFFTGLHETYTRKINYNNFWKIHGDLDSDYIKGYYGHLIADELWLNGFYAPWLKKLIQNKPEIQTTYHHDFMVLNHLLLQEYTDALEIISKIEVPKDIPIIEGITTKNLEILLDALDQDRMDNKDSLQVFTYDSITSYIRTCVDRIVYNIHTLDKEDLRQVHKTL